MISTFFNILRSRALLRRRVPVRPYNDSMPKLYFRHGTVGSAKTLNLLAVAQASSVATLALIALFWPRSRLLVMLAIAQIMLVFSLAFSAVGLGFLESRLTGNPKAASCKWFMWEMHRIHALKRDHLECASALHKFCIYYPRDSRVPYALYMMHEQYLHAGKTGTAFEVITYLATNYSESKSGVQAHVIRKRVLKVSHTNRFEHLRARELPEHWLQIRARTPYK